MIIGIISTCLMVYAIMYGFIFLATFIGWLLTRKWVWAILLIVFVTLLLEMGNANPNAPVNQKTTTTATATGVEAYRQEIESGTSSYCYTVRYITDAITEGKSVTNLVYVRGDGHRYETVSWGAHETLVNGKDGFIFVNIKGVLYYGEITNSSKSGYGYKLYTGQKVYELNKLVYTYGTIADDWS